MTIDWESSEIASLIDQALLEDLGTGDLTTQTLIAGEMTGRAHFLAKAGGILAGLPLVERIFKRVDIRTNIEILATEGAVLNPGDIFCRVSGPVTALLAAERVALNFLQRLCGIASTTARFVREAAPLNIQIRDTRKTTPLLRRLERYAVAVGGGTNHRFGLYDAVLVKDNHLRLQPDFREILYRFQEKGFPPERVEIEVTSINMLKAAMKAGCLNFLLDNMTPSEVRKCVKIKRNHVTYEVSGGISEQSFHHYLIKGVDAISIGALTHSPKSLDISMEMEI